MKAVLIFGKLDARVVDVDIPKISADEIRVKLLECGICGTDIEKYEGDFLTPPILGHETVGIIDEVGEDIKEFKKGQRVFVHHHVPCRVCYYCLKGDFTLCEQFVKFNLDPSGLAEYFRVPSEIIRKKGVFVLSDKISDDRATFIEPLACCIRALNKIKPEIGENVAIFGGGPAGLLHLLLLNKVYGARVAVVEINEKRLEFSQKVGAEILINPLKHDTVEELKKWSYGRGADVAIVATGNVEAVKQALKSLRRGGKLCLFGSPKKGTEIILDLSYIFINEIKIIPSYSTTEFEIMQSISLLERSIIEPEILISHKFKLEEAVEALEKTRKGETIKAVIVNTK